MVIKTGMALTVLLVEEDLELVLMVILQAFVHPLDGLLVRHLAVHEGATAGLLHHL